MLDMSQIYKMSITKCSHKEPIETISGFSGSHLY